MSNPKKKKAINMLKLLEDIEKFCKNYCKQTHCKLDYTIDVHTQILPYSVINTGEIELNAWITAFEKYKNYYNFFNVHFSITFYNQSSGIFLYKDLVLFFAKKGFSIISFSSEDKVIIEFTNKFRLYVNKSKPFYAEE